MTRHSTCAELLEEANLLILGLGQPEWHTDALLWRDRYHDWLAEQSLGESE